MGEVLENGVYLPDEGERNAYNGLKGNWNTVDTVVAQVQALSSAGLIRKAVDELPTEDIETNVIYMLKATKPNGDTYRIEYMYIDGHWDALGTSETTLDDYYTKAETDDLPAVKSGINATRVSNYDAHLANNDIHVTLANKQSWDGKQNALDANQTAAVNSGVTAAKVTGYDSHVNDTDVHVTAGEKSAWNAKQDGLSQTQLAAVNSGITEAKRTGYDNHVADTDVHVTTADKAAWNGKQNALTQTQLDNIAAVPDKANSADLATVATTGDYGDLLNAPAIPTVNNATLTIQKNGADVATFTANASSNVTADLAIPTKTSELDNDAGFLTQHNPVDNELSATSENALQNKVVKSELDGKAPLVHAHAASDVTSGTFNIARIPNLDASKITSGTIDIARLPKGALERLVKVADQTARYALTTDDVQLGDTVQQLDTGVMYVVTDVTKLDSADGYTEFTAGSATSVPWSGVTGKPSSFTPSSHTHGNITNNGKLPTASRALISDSSKNITVSSVTDTELGYLSGVTSSVQTQLNSKAASNHVHGNITNDGKVGTTANKPLITGTGGVVQAGAFGNAANTFCEGNDSRLSDARTPVAHTHTKSDVTDLFNSANTWSGDNTFSGTNSFTAANINIKSSNFSLGDTVSSNQVKRFQWYDASNNRYACIAVNYATDKSVWIDFPLRTKNTEGTAFVDKTIRFQVKPDNTSALLPVINSATDLGSASYQWKSVYAQSYYYNGVAWGLDKANVWTGTNTFKTTITYDGTFACYWKRPNLTVGTLPSTAMYYGATRYADSAGTTITLTRGLVDTSGKNYFRQYTYAFGNTSKFCSMGSGIDADGSNSYFAFNAESVIPGDNNTTDLGTSTRKWKTINGINPGILSFPCDKGDRDPIDSEGWDLTNYTANFYTPTEDGWIFAGANADAIQIDNTGGWGQTSTKGGDGYCECFVPVRKGLRNQIRFKNCTILKDLYFYPCLGNV